MRFKVIKDGREVWSHEQHGDDYPGSTIFPAEYRRNPTSGVVELYVDDVLIGRQEPISDEEKAEVEAGYVETFGALPEGYER
jgi:hypothetical protein